jgi:diacylglycerol kinase family enzyme
MPQLGPIFVVVNPTAAYGKTSMRWSAIQDALRAQGLEFTAALTERRGHAAELARQAAEQGFRSSSPWAARAPCLRWLTA